MGVQLRRCVFGLKLFLVNPHLQFSFELGEAGAKLEDLVNVDPRYFCSIGMALNPEFKVVRIIVSLDRIFVVNQFPRIEIATKHFLHNETMFRNLLVFLSLNKWMIWSKNVNISPTIDVPLLSRYFFTKN